METVAVPSTWLLLGRSVLLGLAILALTWIVSKWAQALLLKLLRVKRVDEALARFLSSIAQYVVLVAGVVAALGTVGIETTSLVAILGSAGLAVGLALQGSLSHFASGVMILFFRPFTLGDIVTIAGQSGKVTDIGLFATTLLTPDNQTIIVPNSAIMAASIVNTTRQGTRSGEVAVTFPYGSDIPRATEILLAAARRAPHVLPSPAPAVSLHNLAPGGLEFRVLAWSKADEHAAMLAGLRQAIYEDLSRIGGDAPLGQIVVKPPTAGQ